ncbi:hypothetical protein EYZ11_004243 [Aspergillus tanneri]|uniref:Uncharacterized protein n=1 Tax=Aspergillus tanneri TaxID=1220188 RepID=A0A4S3JLF0_9EURO|nr:uncharacterized protein ATNIH1004_004601 [Aspergillus tanneri]KAA8648716.1 hypothetical protein ATNIH1004_004601 [Aspergillus tanneri]THC96293.1 hypothetical protein EYZ11_004243 [Aspergillus tanneri]
MLFNLGLTADAAAAHENDIVRLPLESRPSRHSSPPVSFALPSLGLGNLQGWHKGVDADKSERRSRGVMAMSAEESEPSDGEYSTAGPAIAAIGRPNVSRAQSVRKQSSRPKTSYQLAHPASHSRHRRLNFRPKLVLQLQRVSQTPRPLPVLDVLPSTVYLPRLARRFPTIFRGKKGLGPNDLIVVTSDLYDRSGGDIAEKHPVSDDENGEHREVVATICQLREDALSKGKAEICLNYGPVWEASPLSNGSYEFVADTENGIQILRWVLRGGKSRRVSAPPGSPLQEDSRRFTFSVIDPSTRRHPVIASMTRNHLEVYDEYSMPTSGFASPTSAMSVISDCSEMDAPLDRRVITTGDHLRTLIIVTSIWVAFREGWSHNFSYKDSAVTVNSKTTPVASRHVSPTASKTENNQMAAGKDGQPDGSIFNGSKHRLSGSHTAPTRANSTGAAFIERTNRRVSGVHSRSNRHSSLLSNSREPAPNGASGFHPAREASGIRQTWSSPRQPDIQCEKGHTPDQPGYTEERGSWQPDASHENAAQTLSRSAEQAPTKGKRRHRFSSIFDFLTRKSGHH